MNTAKVADALIAKSRGILTRPRQGSADTLTVRLPIPEPVGPPDVSVMRIEAHIERFGHVQS